MADQATSLRLLKRMAGNPQGLTAADPEGFLNSILRPCRFTTVLVLVLDHEKGAFSPLQTWISPLLDSNKRAVVLDQAGLFSAGILCVDQDDQLPSIQPIETAANPILAIPRISQLPQIVNDSLTRKMQFVKYLDQIVGSAGEFWIILPFSLFSSCQAFIHAVDHISILLPDIPVGALKGYEVVKSVYLSGCHVPISLMLEPSGNAFSPKATFERIFSVAKKFLSLDLEDAGVIISGSVENSNEDTVCPIRCCLNRINPNARDFLFSFAERLTFPSPGDRQTRND